MVFFLISISFIPFQLIFEKWKLIYIKTKYIHSHFLSSLLSSSALDFSHASVPHLPSELNNSWIEPRLETLLIVIVNYILMNQLESTEIYSNLLDMI